MRLGGNQVPISGTRDMSVGEFYQKHRTAGNSEVYFTKLPKGVKGKVMSLELWIDPDEVCFNTCNLIVIADN